MIEWLDQFVDTRAKRRHLLYLIALFACILLVLPYLFLGLRLLQLSDYPSVFALLKEPLISQTYVSRIILDTISLVILFLPVDLVDLFHLVDLVVLAPL